MFSVLSQLQPKTYVSSSMWQRKRSGGTEEAVISPGTCTCEGIIVPLS